MENLIKEVLASESTKNKWRNKYDSIEFKNATKLNKLLFGIHLNQSVGCQCVEDLFFYIKRKNNFMNKFKLRKGLVVTSFLHSTITEHSTDAEFIQALKVSPASIKYFTEYPENWKDIVSGKEILPSSKEMREQLKEKGITIPKGTKQPELTKLWQESK
jgi:hypothetical protein